ncbi:site-specific integrase [Rhodobacter sp. KR11]|uniref:site-specific integrase n=1 Tax=Rhodobacter sp. KR11 TaxID=2974588 RepID=UPI0022237DFC|nr:site-specific integrase [Rhodobacter sp. KR11]MCW1919979.1 site-specific integrase [Rhodobacter sp. KR11]
MKNVQHIRGKWVARIVVPDELRPVIGKRELVEELPTEAKARERRALAVLNGFHAQLDDARDKLAASRPTATTAGKAHYRAELEADDREREVPVVGTGALPVRPIYARKLRLLIGGKLEADEAEALIGYAANDLIARGLAPDVRRSDLLKLLAEVQLEALARFEERDEGKIKLPTPTLPILNEPDPSPVSAPKASPTGATLNDVLKGFHKERNAGGRTLAQKTMDEHEVAVRMFEEAQGGPVAVKAITKQMVIAYKKTLLETPTRYTQRFPGLTLPQAIKANAKRPEPYETLSPQTINMKWLSHLSSILQWATNNALIDFNPAKGVRVDTGSAIHKEPSRRPFDAEEIKLIFGNEIFAAPARYESRQWALLLALYTGARSSSELARIALSDVTKDQGIDVFDLSGASKNTRSKRLVPIHTDLIKLGLFEYAAKLRAEGQTKLFPDWEPEDRINRWFLRTFLPKLGIDASDKVFHSFRHNFKTELVRSGCSRELQDLITGHEDQSVAAVYVHEAPIKRMSEALNKVNFGLPIQALKT